MFHYFETHSPTTPFSVMAIRIIGNIQPFRKSYTSIRHASPHSCHAVCPRRIPAPPLNKTHTKKKKCGTGIIFKGQDFKALPNTRGKRGWDGNGWDRRSNIRSSVSSPPGRRPHGAAAAAAQMKFMHDAEDMVEDSGRLRVGWAAVFLTERWGSRGAFIVGSSGSITLWSWG